MRAALSAAHHRGVEAVVCTFYPHTTVVLRPDTAPPMLQTLEQRLAAIAGLGVDLTVVIPFDRDIAATGHRSFVDEFLCSQLHVGSLHVSKGFSFGRDKTGSTAYLEKRASECGFRVERVPPLLIDGQPVSSTRIRDLLAAGDIAKANELLGRPYAVVGTVVEGAGRGRGLRVPTANLEVRNGCLPARGVYVTEARLPDGPHSAVTNVGRRPTFGGSDALVVETHLLDGGGDLYGDEIEVAFLERVREERRFDSPEQLRAQIVRDIEAARLHFARLTARH
jgi:riboflavin kinase/FMN adenylyltransferase